MANNTPSPQHGGPSVTVNGVAYDYNTLPDAAKQLVTQMRVADQELHRQQALTAMIHAARQTWGAQLAALLPVKHS